jgi:hypothetical protein
MYSRADWEIVNSILAIYTAVINPNPLSSSVILMYSDVFRLTIIIDVLLCCFIIEIIRGSRCAAGPSSTAEGSLPRNGPRRLT